MTRAEIIEMLITELERLQDCVDEEDYEMTKELLKRIKDNHDK